MISANITRDEARRRSEHLSAQSYEVLVDVSGRGQDGTPLARPQTRFVSTTRARFRTTGPDNDTVTELLLYFEGQAIFRHAVCFSSIQLESVVDLWHRFAREVDVHHSADTLND